MAISEDAQKYLVAVEKKRKAMVERGGQESGDAYVQGQKKIARQLETEKGDRPTSNAAPKTPISDDSNLRMNARSVLAKKNGVDFNLRPQAAKDGNSRSRIAEAIRPKPVGKINPGAIKPGKVKMNAVGTVDMKKRG